MVGSPETSPAPFAAGVVRIEVDFCPLPDIVDNEYGFWLGMVVNHEDGSILMHNIDQELPNLEEIAHLLAGTMNCAHPSPRRRPKAVLFGMILNGTQWFPT